MSLFICESITWPSVSFLVLGCSKDEFLETNETAASEGLNNLLPLMNAKALTSCTKHVTSAFYVEQSTGVQLRNTHVCCVPFVSLRGCVVRLWFFPFLSSSSSSSQVLPLELAEKSLPEHLWITQIGPKRIAAKKKWATNIQMTELMLAMTSNESYPHCFKLIFS